jgi:hypothetical protein
MKSVMLDLETLSSQPDAVVISIGVAAFNETEVIASAGWALDFGHLLPGHIDPRTVKWWGEQSEEARRFSFSGLCRPFDVACQVAGFFKVYGGDECWANDPSFDCVILRNWWKGTSYAGNFPAHYREERSCRTIFAEARRLGCDLSPAYEGIVAHNPESDAVAQAKAVILARRYIENGCAPFQPMVVSPTL